MTNLISVIVPVYNSGKYLPACLESLKNQTYTNLEILLIDDGSTDNSGSICDEYAKKDSRFKVYHKTNGGVSSARNLGLDNAVGEWVSFVDSDDYLELNAYETMLSYYDKAAYDIIIFDFDIVYPNKTVKHTENTTSLKMLNRNEAIAYNLHVNSFPFTRLNKLSLVNGKAPFRLQKIRFDESVFRGEDSIFNSQVTDVADNILLVPNKLYHYVQSEDSACRGEFRKSQLTVLKMDDFYQNFYGKKYPNLLNEWEIHFIETLISIYFDMYIDKNDLKKEMKDFFISIKNKYKKIDKSKLSLKQRIKFNLFIVSPSIYCFFHKTIWKL